MHTSQLIAETHERDLLRGPGHHTDHSSHPDTRLFGPPILVHQLQALSKRARDQGVTPIPCQVHTGLSVACLLPLLLEIARCNSGVSDSPRQPGYCSSSDCPVLQVSSCSAQHTYIAIFHGSRDHMDPGMQY